METLNYSPPTIATHPEAEDLLLEYVQVRMAFDKAKARLGKYESRLQEVFPPGTEIPAFMSWQTRRKLVCENPEALDASLTKISVHAPSVNAYEKREGHLPYGVERVEAGYSLVKAKDFPEG